MSRYFTRGIQVVIDLLLLCLAYLLAFAFRFEFALPDQGVKLLFFTWPYVVLFQYLTLVLFGVPNLAWRYIGLRDLTRFAAAVSFSTAVLVGLRLALGSIPGHMRYVVIPMGVLAMNFVLSFLFITGVRVLRRILAERDERARHTARPSRPELVKRTLLIGAGRAGVNVAKEVRQNPHLGMQVVGFIDDDPGKIGTLIQGSKVLGDTTALGAVREAHSVDQAVISIAAASGGDIRRIVVACEQVGLPVKIIPGIYEILGGEVNLSRIREVTIEDLLGREAVELDMDALHAFVRNRRVIITGAGGSIGSELCRQVLALQPSSIVLLEQAENPLFEIHKELLSRAGEVAIHPCIADVCDTERVRTVFDTHRPEVVFHAAAHKHVPMMEWNPGEAVKNNILGTKSVADAAEATGAEAFVLISTDKAVNPTSIMGATKRMAELYIQGLSQTARTRFSAVRFGNVMGSAGSVIPIFKAQIAAGGPVTVTHPEMKRYFMTIPEACQLVMQAGSMGVGGEIFVLDMGQPVRILELAKDLIRLSGFSEEEIPIALTGVRPGEKLFEELSVSGEDMAKTRHPKIFIGKIASFAMAELDPLLRDLGAAARTPTRAGIRDILGRVIPELGTPEDEKETAAPASPSKPVTPPAS